MTDAHCHPLDLLEFNKNAEEERRETGTAAAANSVGRVEFEYHEELKTKARIEGAPPLFCCFALHPQMSPAFLENAAGSQEKNMEGGCCFSLSEGLELLQSLAAEGRLDAVGETGFDLYDERYRAAEKIQDEMFRCHLESALHYSLPLVIHARRAMHKIFPYAKELKKLPAVVFHSWPGSRGEGEALLRRGINAFFSFGSAVCKNHKEAIASAALLPIERLLFETDSPYQPLRGNSFSSWRDLSIICSSVAAFRKEAGRTGSDPIELEEVTASNFFGVFSR